MTDSDSLKNSGKVLIVDDEASVRMVLEIILLGSGHEVVSTGDPAEVERLCDENVIDLVLLDLNFPDVDGLEVCRRIRERDRDLPVIMISGSNDRSTCQRTLTNGATDFIGKPIDASEVMIRVKNAVRVRQLQRQLEQQSEKYHHMVKLVSRLDEDIHEIHVENGDEAKKKQLSEILSDYSREESDVGEWIYPDI